MEEENEEVSFTVCGISIVTHELVTPRCIMLVANISKITIAIVQ